LRRSDGRERHSKANQVKEKDLGVSGAVWLGHGSLLVERDHDGGVVRKGKGPIKTSQGEVSILRRAIQSKDRISCAEELRAIEGRGGLDGNFKNLSVGSEEGQELQSRDCGRQPRHEKGVLKWNVCVETDGGGGRLKRGGDIFGSRGSGQTVAETVSFRLLLCQRRPVSSYHLRIHKLNDSRFRGSFNDSPVEKHNGCEGRQGEKK
jgi:hypothetical protein